MSMEHLPTSIATSLEEAGFSGTEIVILRRLMDGEPLTIRQLGAKTGKSTGLLDQAMKKLLKKNIIKKTLINDVPKYSLDSLEAVVEWMQDDMEQKREMLLRRHQNFESFVTSLETGSKRPDIEYFEGESGLKQAYIKLLNGPGEILHYLPVQWKEEEDPLRDFRVQYFRERQHRKMFSRVLAHDSSLGRRYQSRDAFEYRKTVLISETEYPFSFEKIITGDRIACFDHTAKTACVIRYPELADIEKTLFEAIWRQVQVLATTQKEGIQKDVIGDLGREKIALSTESLSQVREFFLSKKSWVVFGIFAALAAVITSVLYWQNESMNKLRIHERVKSIASTAALQFTSNDLNQLRTPTDVEKPEYKKVVYQLNDIRRQNEGVKYLYLMRPTTDSKVWEFIADADGLKPFSPRDLNGDGVINEMDHVSPSGEKYVNDEDDTNAFILNYPTSYDMYTDQWGTVLSGSAPIHDAEGNPIAIVGVDVGIETLRTLQRASFAPIAWFFAFFFFFLIIRLAAFNRSVLREVLNIIRVRNLVTIFMLLSKRVIILFLLFVACLVVGGLELYKYHNQQLLIEETGKRLMAIAATAALTIDASDLEGLRKAEDMKKVEYQRVWKQLNLIRKQNPEILYIFIQRPTNDEDIWEFVVDADTNYYLPEYFDNNNDGSLDEADENSPPGTKNYWLAKSGKRALNGPYYERAQPNQWCDCITGMAPIKDSSGNVVAILEADLEI